MVVQKLKALRLAKNARKNLVMVQKVPKTKI